MKAIFIDTETGGTDPKVNALLQVAAVVFIDGVEKGRYNWKMKPAKGKIIDPEALAVTGCTLEEIETREESAIAFQAFRNMLSQYISKFDRRDKFQMIGWNSQFDDSFLREWFKGHGDNYYGSWIAWPTIDAAVLCAHANRQTRGDIPSFKLAAIGKHYGLQFNEADLHDAMADIDLTILVYRKLNGGKVD